MISTEITRLQGAKSSLKTSIENKGVTVPSSTKLDGYSALVDQICTGATEAPENDVNFYDYDGFRVASYTIAEAKALTALPTPPTHEGLTFQEWNWSLSDLTSYNRRYADIGANYIPTDGKTHFFIDVPFDSLAVKMYINGEEGTLDVDWGDGTTHGSKTWTSSSRYSFEHTYESAGKYDIKFTFTQSSNNGYWSTYNRNNAGTIYWSVNIYEIWCGNHFSLNSQNSVGYCGNLKLAISKGTSCQLYSISNSIIPQLNLPKNNTLNLNSGHTIPSGADRVSFPKSVVSLSSGDLMSGQKRGKIILPEWTDESVLADSAIKNNSYTTIISIPSCAQFSTGSNAFQNLYCLRVIDIVQGWTPATSLTFSVSINYYADALVDFFNKLGTTSTAITLTFGTTNLNKLTADQKAIATNKGYTLA